MARYRIGPEAIEAFCRSWPCHGLPDNLDALEVEFASNGDLVDLEAFNEFDGWTLDTHDFDGPALAALVSDAAKIGEPL